MPVIEGEAPPRPLFTSPKSPATTLPTGSLNVTAQRNGPPSVGLRSILAIDDTVGAIVSTVQLYEVADARTDSALESGQLLPGQRVRGTVVFRLPRGNVTLMMSDLSNQSVTALRIAG